MTFRPREHQRRKVTFKSTAEPLTEQGHRELVSIHAIMRRYRQSGVIDHVNKHMGEYMDMSSAPDYHEAQNIIARAQTMFESVPAHIRLDFDNDPQQYIDFMQNPDNREQIEAYGLDASHLPAPEYQPQPIPEPTSDPKVPQNAPQEPTEAPNQPQAEPA